MAIVDTLHDVQPRPRHRWNCPHPVVFLGGILQLEEVLRVYGLEYKVRAETAGSDLFLAPS